MENKRLLAAALGVVLAGTGGLGGGAVTRPRSMPDFGYMPPRMGEGTYQRSSGYNDSGIRSRKKARAKYKAQRAANRQRRLIAAR